MNRTEFIKAFNYSEWSVQDGVFICPCGKKVEDDGECPESHVSPFVQEGII